MAVGERMMKPYPGMGSGHAVNDTSEERQQRNDGSGNTSHVQSTVLKVLGRLKAEGMTAAELEDALQIGHGMASSAFSHLHRAGRVKRVKMRRGRHEIYVLPEYVNGREESPYRPRPKQQRHPRDYTREEWDAAVEKAGLEPMPLTVRTAMRIAQELP